MSKKQKCIFGMVIVLAGIAGLILGGGWLCVIPFIGGMILVSDN